MEKWIIGVLVQPAPVSLNTLDYLLSHKICQPGRSVASSIQTKERIFLPTSGRMSENLSKMNTPRRRRQAYHPNFHSPFFYNLLRRIERSVENQETTTPAVRKGFDQPPP
jgi:hypothetical protein